MSEDPAPGPVDPTGGEDDPGAVVRRIQAYLEELRRHGNSDSPDKDEWDRFFQSHLPLLHRLVRSHQWSEANREDFVQEVWLLLVTRLPDLHFDPHRGDLQDWISTVARHRLADTERCRRNHTMERMSLAVAGLLAGREPDPIAACEQKDLQELVRDALAELRPQVAERDFESFELHWFRGLSVREISQRLGISERQVWSSHHRMSEKLRPLLARRLGPDFSA